MIRLNQKIECLEKRELLILAPLLLQIYDLIANLNAQLGDRYWVRLNTEFTKNQRNFVEST